MTAGLTLTAEAPFRLAAVAVSHGWFQTAPFSWDPDAQVLERVESLGTLRIHAAKNGVRVHAPAPLGPEQRPAVAVRVTRMLQLDADLTGFPAAVRAVDRRLARDLAAYGGGRVLAGGSLFEDVVKGICGTNTTWTQAVTAINRIAVARTRRRVPRPRRRPAGGRGLAEDRGARGLPRTRHRRGLAIGDRRDPRRDRRRLPRRRHRPHRGGPAPAGRRRARHRRVPAAADGPLRPPVDRLGDARGSASREWFAGRRPTPREVLRRVAPAGRYSGLVLAWLTLRAWQREIGSHPLSAPAAGWATRSSRARQRPAQASQVCSAAHAAPVRPSTSRSAGSEASRASWRA